MFMLEDLDELENSALLGGWESTLLKEIQSVDSGVKTLFGNELWTKAPGRPNKNVQVMRPLHRFAR